jgi:hypothetical protein
MARGKAHTILHSAAPDHAIGRRSVCEPDARAVTNLDSQRQQPLAHVGDHFTDCHGHRLGPLHGARPWPLVRSRAKG